MNRFEGEGPSQEEMGIQPESSSQLQEKNSEQSIENSENKELENQFNETANAMVDKASILESQIQLANPEALQSEEMTAKSNRLGKLLKEAAQDIARTIKEMGHDAVDVPVYLLEGVSTDLGMSKTAEVVRNFGTWLKGKSRDHGFHKVMNMKTKRSWDMDPGTANSRSTARA